MLAEQISSLLITANINFQHALFLCFLPVSGLIVNAAGNFSLMAKASARLNAVTASAGHYVIWSRNIKYVLVLHTKYTLCHFELLFFHRKSVM